MYSEIVTVNRRDALMIQETAILPPVTSTLGYGSQWCQVLGVVFVWVLCNIIGTLIMAAEKIPFLGSTLFLFRHQVYVIYSSPYSYLQTTDCWEQPIIRGKLQGVFAPLPQLSISGRFQYNSIDIIYFIEQFANIVSTVAQMWRKITLTKKIKPKL